VIIGSPAPVIVNLSNEIEFDLIIMTTHGKGGIKRAVMGSITDEVVRNAGIPVLVINPREQKK
jgi:nucleotide-binding universal stress UspA family protein